jgi:hypothetical protein
VAEGAVGSIEARATVNIALSVLASVILCSGW